MSFLTLPFMKLALLSCLLAGVALSLLGLFVVARRMTFSGLAGSQWAALGTVVGVSLGYRLGATALAAFFVVGVAVFLSWLGRDRRVPLESWVGALYVLGAGSAVLILAKSPGGEADTLTLFFGNLLALGATEVWEALVFFVLTAVFLFSFFHRLLWIAVDPTGAQVAGERVRRWNFLFDLLFALGLTLAIHLFGVLLAFAYLLLPPAAGFVAARRVKTLVVFVPFLTAAVTVLGFALSYHWDFPTGPFVAVLLAAVVLLLKVLPFPNKKS